MNEPNQLLDTPIMTEQSENDILQENQLPFIEMDEEYVIDCQEETFQTHNGIKYYEMMINKIGSVFCASMPKVNSIKFSKCILTGGEDDYAYLWNSESFEQIKSISIDI